MDVESTSELPKIIQDAFDKANKEAYELRNARSESDMKKGIQIFRNAIETQFYLRWKARRREHEQNNRDGM